MAIGAGIRLSFQGCGFSSSEAGSRDGKNPDQFEIIRLLPDNQTNVASAFISHKWSDAKMNAAGKMLLGGEQAHDF